MRNSIQDSTSEENMFQPPRKILIDSPLERGSRCHCARIERSDCNLLDHPIDTDGRICRCMVCSGARQAPGGGDPRAVNDQGRHILPPPLTKPTTFGRARPSLTM